MVSTSSPQVPTATIPRAKTSMISVSQIDIPADARSHDPAALEILAHDMGEQGQLQEIIVTPSKYGGQGVTANGVTPILPHSPTRYVVIAGVGRTLAARKLGWKEIRASVREGVSEFDKARITFAENEDREDVDPFYQASLIQRMLKTNGSTQEALAKELGLSEGLVSGYVKINQLPKEIGEKFKRLNLGQLIQIIRLNNTDSKIEFAANCAKNDLSVRQLKALVDRALKKPASAKATVGKPAPSDPLAKVWPDLQSKLMAATDAFWEVHYGVHKMPDNTPMTGWFFFVKPQVSSPRPGLAKWFRNMAQALEGGKVDDMLEETRGQAREAKKMMADAMGPVRLPKTLQEEEELKTISATKGPKAVYEWIYGPDSPMVQAVPVNRWEDIGTTPMEGLKQVLDGIRQFQKMTINSQH